jgi:hypothetical protein
MGKELIQLGLQRALQRCQQHADDTSKGKDGIASEIDRTVAVLSDEIGVGQR